MATTTRGRPRGSRNKKKGYPPESTPKKPKEVPEAKKWLQRIDRAKKVKEEWRKMFRVDLCYEYFEGRHRPAHIPVKEWITINLIYSDLRTMLPTLYSTDPYYYVKLKKSFHPDPDTVAEYEVMGKIRQGMLNYLKGEVGLKRKSRVSILDSMFQFGITKTLFRGDRIANPKAGQPIMGEDSRPMLDPESGEPVMQPDFFIENGRWDVERVHPDDFLVDEDAGPLEETVGFMAHRMKRSLEDVQRDNSRTKLYRENVKATEQLSDFEKQKEQRKKGAAYASHNEKKDAEIVVEWEIWDIKNKQWMVVAEGCDYFGIEPDEIPKGIERHPFSELRYMLRDSSWYPIPPVSQLVDPMREYCERRSKILVHSKRFNRKYTVASQFLVNPEKAMVQLENGDDGTMVETTQPGEIVYPIKDAPLDQSVHTELAYLRKDFDDLSTGANQRGATQGVESAREAGIIEMRSQVREGDQVGLVIDFLTDIGRKLDMLVQAYLDKDMAVRITGPEGEYWMKVSQEHYKDIEGEYEYSIAVGSTSPQLPEIERAQMLGFLQILAGPGIVLALEPVLFKRLSESFGLDDTIVEAAGRLAQKMASGQLPWPGQQGSAPNTAGTSEARQGGIAGGVSNIQGG